MHLLPTLLPLIFALGQTTSGAAIQVNILIDDKQLSASATSSPFRTSSRMHSQHSVQSVTANPEEFFQLRAITREGKDINITDVQPFYVDLSILRISPPRLALQPKIRSEPTLFELEDTALTFAANGAEVGALKGVGEMALTGPYGDVPIKFTTVYSECAKAQVLAVLQEDGSGNPDLFMAEDGDLGISNPLFACVPKTSESCPKDKKGIYLRIDELKPEKFDGEL